MCSSALLDTPPAPARARSRGEAARLVPLEVLERQITQLASHINAATCRWLELVAEYDAREGWRSGAAARARTGCRGSAPSRRGRLGSTSASRGGSPTFPSCAPRSPPAG